MYNLSIVTPETAKGEAKEIYEATYHGFFVLTPAMIEKSLSS